MATDSVQDRPAEPLEIYRRARGLGRRDLAELASIHPETLAKLERGESRPLPATARLLAEALDVQVEALFPARPPG